MGDSLKIKERRKRKNALITVKIPKDTAPFLITVKVHEKSKIVCRKCKAVQYFDHDPMGEYRETEKGLRAFKLAHHHDQDV